MLLAKSTLQNPDCLEVRGPNPSANGHGVHESWGDILRDSHKPKTFGNYMEHSERCYFKFEMTGFNNSPRNCSLKSWEFENRTLCRIDSLLESIIDGDLISIDGAEEKVSKCRQLLRQLNGGLAIEPLF